MSASVLLFFFSFFMHADDSFQMNVLLCKMSHGFLKWRGVIITKTKLVTHLVQQKLSRITALEINENTFASRSIFTTCVCLLDILQANAMNWLKPLRRATKGWWNNSKRNVTSAEPARIFHMEGALKSEWSVYE